jgi:hypothetical protein
MKRIRRKFSFRERMQLNIDCGPYWRFLRNHHIGMWTQKRRKWGGVDIRPLFAYERRRREEALRELMQISQEMGLYGYGGGDRDRTCTTL